MSQHDYSLANQDGASFRADLNALMAAILSMNSGSTPPSVTAPFMFWADTSTGWMKQRNAGDTAWVNLWRLGGEAAPVGGQIPFAGRVAPAGWLMCFGQAVSRTTYADLYTVLCPVLGTFTVTIASPGVITLNGHGLSDGDRTRIFTTGALPTGLSANTDYYVTASTTNTFQLSATRGGAAINTSGTQSGTHTAQFFGYGAGDGSTTFNLPDKRGRGSIGRDNMGGTAASRVTPAGSGIYGAALGANGGAETHTLTSAQIPAHAHPLNGGSDYYLMRTTGGSVGMTSGTGVADTVTNTSNNTGGGGAHNNTQPSEVDNWIIKY